MNIYCSLSRTILNQGHTFEPLDSARMRMYHQGVLVSFDGARTGALTKHDFLDVTSTEIELQVAGGGGYTCFFFYCGGANSHSFGKFGHSLQHDPGQRCRPGIFHQSVCKRGHRKLTNSLTSFYMKNYYLCLRCCQSTPKVQFCWLCGRALGPVRRPIKLHPNLLGSRSAH